MNDDLRSALRELSIGAPSGLDSGRLDMAIVKGGRARRRRRTAQGLGVCAVVAAISLAGVQFGGHKSGQRPIAADCARIPDSEVTELTANLKVSQPVRDKLSVIATFTARTSFRVSVQGPYSSAYVLDSENHVVAHAEPPLILSPIVPHKDFRTQPGQGYPINTSVDGFRTCGGGTLSSLPAGRFQLVMVFGVAAGRDYLAPGELRLRALVTRPGGFTIP